MFATNSTFVRWRDPPETELRAPAWITLPLALFLLAAPREPGAEVLGAAQAAGQRGPAAVLRARLDAARALQGSGQASGAVAAVDQVLADLSALAAAEQHDPLGGHLDRAAAGALLREATEARAQGAAELASLPGGARGDFLRAVAPGAILGDWQYGVPASVTMAQAILESGWGRRAPGYNLFGMKGEGPAGSTRSRVVEYARGKRSVRRAHFRAYHSLAEAMADHARVLGTAPRYATARARSESPGAFALALQGTYATDPRYAQKLAVLADSYGLEAFNWRGRPPLSETTGLPFLAEQLGPT